MWQGTTHRTNQHMIQITQYPVIKNRGLQYLVRNIIKAFPQLFFSKSLILGKQLLK